MNKYTITSRVPSFISVRGKGKRQTVFCLGDVGRKLVEILFTTKETRQNLRVIKADFRVGEVYADTYGHTLLRLAFPKDYYEIELV